MNTAIALPRMTMVPELNIPSLHTIAERAADLLGYTELRANIGDMKTFEVLREMDWMPFVPANVTEYKRNELRKALGLGRFNPFNSLKWHWCELSNYKLPIPVDVLSKASELRYRMSKEHLRCEFRIAYMGTVDFDYEKAKEMRLLDPFLVLSRNGVAHHIEVWDEPTFNPKRQK